jgi:ribosomal protein S18 acetylase RimI-like enzyme
LRGQGLAGAVVAGLCARLRRSVDHIGLNVKADDVSAIGLYERLGFSVVAEYLECAFQARS